MGENSVAIITEGVSNVRIVAYIIIVIIYREVVFLSFVRELELLGNTHSIRHTQRLKLGFGVEVVIVVTRIVDEGMLDDDARDTKGARLADDAIVVPGGAAVIVGVIYIAGIIVARLNTTVVQSKGDKLIENLLGKFNTH